MHTAVPPELFTLISEVDLQPLLSLFLATQNVVPGQAALSSLGGLYRMQSPRVLPSPDE